MRSLLVLLGALVAAAAALRPPALRPPPPATALDGCSRTRRLLIPAALAAVLLPAAAPANAAEAAAGDCLTDCVRECNLVAPGNLGYCQEQCDAYCKDNSGPTGTGDVLRQDVTALTAKDCSGYKTDSARAYCAKQNALAAAPKPKPASPMQMNNGIFGDSGVTYSQGVEELLASAFGATRQAKPVGEAAVDEFAGEVFDKAKSALLGGN